MLILSTKSGLLMLCALVNPGHFPVEKQYHEVSMKIPWGETAVRERNLQYKRKLIWCYFLKHCRLFPFLFCYSRLSFSNLIKSIFCIKLPGIYQKLLFIIAHATMLLLFTSGFGFLVRKARQTSLNTRSNA